MDSSQTRLGAALFGGYLLGKTNKGGMMLRLATQMLLKGTGANPRELVQENVLKALQSDIVDQIRAQAMEAAKAALDARLQGIAQNLTDRTEALKSAGDAASEAASGATDTANKQAHEAYETGQQEYESVKDKVVPKGERDDEPEQDEGDEEEQDDEQGEQEDQAAEEQAEGGEDEGEGEDAEAESEDEGDEPDDADDEEASIAARAEDLKKKRITSLRKMAKEMFDESAEDQINEASKDNLARWIAEEEADTGEDED